MKDVVYERCSLCARDLHVKKGTNERGLNRVTAGQHGGNNTNTNTNTNTNLIRVQKNRECPKKKNTETESSPLYAF